MESGAHISKKKLRNSEINRIVAHIPLAWPNYKYLFVVIILLASTSTGTEHFLSCFASMYKGEEKYGFLLSS